MKKLLVGIAISAVFVYLSLRGVDYSAVIKEFENPNYIFLIPAFGITILILFLRSVRLALLLSPLERIEQKRMLPITCTGNMFTILIPMRLGEIVRSYLISSKSSIPMASSLSIIFMERVFDLSALLLIMLYVILSFELPVYIVGAGYGLFVSFLVFLLIILFLYHRREFSMRLLRPFIRGLSVNMQDKVLGLISTFIDGFFIIGSFRRTLFIFVISFLIWTVAVIGFYPMLYLLNLKLPLISAFVIMVFVAAGVSIPTAPGFLGNYQFSCILALSFFNIPKDTALAFSIVTYLIGIVSPILLGLLFLPFMDFSFSRMKRVFQGVQ